MKKIFYFIAALVLLSAVSCVKEEAPVAPSTESMIVTLGFDGEDTKASFSDKWGITWYVGSTVKWKVDGVLKTHTVTESEFNNGENTVTFAAEGLKPGDKIWVNSDSPVYESYIQSNPGNAEWNRIFLAGTVAEAGEVTKMKIVGSILRFIPYANDEAAKAESVKSVTIEGLDKDYTVTLKDGKELSLAEITSKAQSKSIFLPLAAAEYDSFKVTVQTLAGTKYVFNSGAGKTLTLAENSVVNMSLPLSAAHKDNSVVVTFNTNGGSSLTPVILNKGEKVGKPADPEKTGALPEGLYAGKVDPSDATLTFAGWYADEGLTDAYDFNTTVSSDITLYAKWDAGSIDVSGQSGSRLVNKAFAYLNSLTAPDAKTSYTCVVTTTCTWENQLTLNKANIDLYLVGGDQEVKLGHSSWDQTMLKCSAGHLYVGNNITITGVSATGAAIVAEGGDITMSAGSKVDWDIMAIGETKAKARALLYVNNENSTITIDGCQIVGNSIKIETGDYMAATVAVNKGHVVMKSGRISGNSVVSDAGGIAICGGIYSAEAGDITKTGGVIENNTATFSQTAVNSGNEVRHYGQQVLFRAISQYWSENKTPGYKGAYKIDSNLSETDNFDAYDLSGAFWVRLNYKG